LSSTIIEWGSNGAETHIYALQRVQVVVSSGRDRAGITQGRMSKIPAVCFSQWSGVSDVLRGVESGFPNHCTGLVVRRGALLITLGVFAPAAVLRQQDAGASSAADKLIVVDLRSGDILFDVFDESQAVGPVAGGGFQPGVEIQEIAIYIVHKKLSYVFADH
jgi:hypothetical protein